MKRVTASVFVLLYVLALARPIAPLIEYTLNYDYISEELCENKEVPQMECNGKCYLTKQFKAESKETKNPQLSIEWQDYPIGFVQLIDKVNLFGRGNKQTLQARYLADLQPAYSYLIPAPPRVA